MPTDPKLLDALGDPSGRLGRPTISDAMPVPEVIHADGSGIVFDFTSKIRAVRPPQGLLDRFVSSRSDAELVWFAKRFGPLALFPSLPGTVHVPDPARLADFCDLHREELASWRRIQTQMKTAMALVASYHSDMAPPIEDLRAFNDSTGGAFVIESVLGSAAKSNKWRQALGLRAGIFYTRALARSCRLTPALRVERNGRTDIVFQDAISVSAGARWGMSLPGALTVQLLSSFAGASLVLCSSCGKAFVPHGRWPAVGRRRYCPECGHKAALRDAKKAYRQRIRAQRIQGANHE